MRKLFTLVALFAMGMGAAMAQNISFTVHGKAVENGGVATIHAENEYYDGDYDGTKAEPELFAVIAGEGAYRMSIEVISEDTPWDYSWCGFGNGSAIGLGNCVMVEKGKVNAPAYDYVIDEASSYDCQLHISFFNDAVTQSTTKAKIRAWDTASDAPAFEFTLVTVYDNTGVAGVEADGVSVQGNVITAEGEISVYDLQGAKVLSAVGQADLTPLGQGIYVYRAAGQAGKVSVK